MTEINIDDLAPCPFCGKESSDLEIWEFVNVEPRVAHKCINMTWPDEVLVFYADNWPRKEKEKMTMSGPDMGIMESLTGSELEASKMLSGTGSRGCSKDELDALRSELNEKISDLDSRQRNFYDIMENINKTAATLRNRLYETKSCS